MGGVVPFGGPCLSHDLDASEFRLAKFGVLLHRIVSPIILGMIFFIVVTPVGLLMRVTGKDPMNRKFDPEAKTYWIDREPLGPAPESMKNQF